MLLQQLRLLTTTTTSTTTTTTTYYDCRRLHGAVVVGLSHHFGLLAGGVDVRSTRGSLVGTRHVALGLGHLRRGHRGELLLSEYDLLKS